MIPEKGRQKAFLGTWNLVQRPFKLPPLRVRKLVKSPWWIPPHRKRRGHGSRWISIHERRFPNGAVFFKPWHTWVGHSVLIFHRWNGGHAKHRVSVVWGLPKSSDPHFLCTFKNQLMVNWWFRAQWSPNQKKRWLNQPNWETQEFLGQQSSIKKVGRLGPNPYPTKIHGTIFSYLPTWKPRIFSMRKIYVKCIDINIPVSWILWYIIMPSNYIYIMPTVSFMYLCIHAREFRKGFF